MRGLFTAGVLDVLMGRGVTFDGIVGVSAGACFGCNYKSGQIGRVIREEVDALYIEGTRYRKTGIVFFGLEKPGTAHQTDLFDDTPPAEKSRLYAAVDALNARYGKGKVFSARLSRGPLRPLRGSRYALSQPDRLRRQAITLGVFASPRVANPRKGRLRPGPRRKVVAHEAAEAFASPGHPLGRADDRAVNAKD